MTGAVTDSEDEPRTPFREWPAVGRWVVYLVVGLAVGLIAATIGTAAVVRRSFPVTDGTITLGRLTSAVDVRRDAHGIPHLLAFDADDLFLAQGYVQAQDRFFAMDVARHRATGRLAELLGKSAVADDLLARTLGWQQVAEEEFGELSEATQGYLRSFSAGVNAYLRQHSPSRASLEYTLLELAGLNYKPDAWTPVDSLAILKADTATWSTDVRTEIDRARLRLDRTGAQVAELYPAPAAPTDAFVVGGGRTASGRPILADAIPAAPGVPSPWIQVGLACEPVTAACPYDVSGVALPGVPGVLAGHNQKVAWGLSTSNTDATDLFLEKVDGHSYLRGRKTRPLEERDEIVRIQGEEPRRLTVRSTTAGPLLSDVSGSLSTVGANAPVYDGAPARENGYAVAVASASLVPGRTADAVFALARASDATTVQVAARDLALPGHDLVYADSADRIGRIVLGPLPVRANGRTGQDATPGWLKGGWPATGAAQVAETDPADGVIADDPRIRSLVLGASDWTASGLGVVQSDTRNPIADALVPALLRVLVPSQYYADGQGLIAHWDYQQAPDSAAAAYFNAVWSNLLALTFHDQLKESLWPDGGTRWMTVVRRLLDDPDNPWWDDTTTDDVVEDRDTILAAALRDARDEMTRRVARDPGEWTWGELHALHLNDGPLGARDLGILDALVDRGPFGVGGGPGTAAGGEIDLRESFDVTRAPAVRFVADLGSPDDSRWVSMTGASGHAFAGHYRDQTEFWLAGGSFRWPFGQDAIRRGSEDLLRLRPRSSEPD